MIVKLNDLTEDQRNALTQRQTELSGIVTLSATETFDANGTVVIEFRNCDDLTHLMRKEILTACGNFGYYP